VPMMMVNVSSAARPTASVRKPARIESNISDLVFCSLLCPAFFLFSLAGSFGSSPHSDKT
jgi:hypothetical protein